MIATLKRLDDVLHPVLHRLTLIVPSVVPLEQARGAVSVEPVLASRSIPERSIALRSGLAVSSLDLVGASPHSPVVLTREPARVTAGDPLPEGCDAVIDATAVTEAGPMILVNDSATPGLNTRLAGQDLRPGAVIVPTGRQLTPEAMLACRLGGICSLTIQQPRVTVMIADASHAAWMNERLLTLGCTIAADLAAGALLIRDTPEAEPRLALRPGETAWIELSADGTVLVDVPRQFDGLMAAWAALVVPTIARLSGLEVHASRRPLTSKIASTIGMTELALLRSARAGYEPLAVGDVSLAAIAQADAYYLVPASAEGHAIGHSLPALRIADPLGLGRPEGSP